MATNFILARYNVPGDGVRDELLDVYALARAAGLHPELVRRLFCLGLFEAAAEGQPGEPRFAPAVALRLRRMVRLRRDLGLSWNALGLVDDLLERIEMLEAALARRPMP